MLYSFRLFLTLKTLVSHLSDVSNINNISNIEYIPEAIDAENLINRVREDDLADRGFDSSHAVRNTAYVFSISSVSNAFNIRNV